MASSGPISNPACSILRHCRKRDLIEYRWMTQVPLRVAKWSLAVNPISICGGGISRGRLPSRARVFSSSPHPILCPIYAAEMPVITKYFLQFVSLEEDSSCRFRPTEAFPDRKSKPHLASALPSLRVCSPFSFHLLFISFHFSPSFRMTWRPGTDGWMIGRWN